MFKNRLRNKKLCQELCNNRNQFYKLAYSWTRDTMLADDLVQEAMQKAFLSFNNLKDESKLRAWTCRIMLNCYHDWLRRKKDTRDIDDFEFVADSTPDRYMSSQDSSRMVRHCIASLNEKHRNVITMIDLMEFSYQEASLALDIPIGTVMSRLCRARNQLRDLLEKYNSQSAPGDPKYIRRVK